MDSKTQQKLQAINDRALQMVRKQGKKLVVSEKPWADEGERMREIIKRESGTTRNRGLTGQQLHDAKKAYEKSQASGAYDHVSQKVDQRVGSEVERINSELVRREIESGRMKAPDMNEARNFQQEMMDKSDRLHGN